MASLTQVASQIVGWDIGGAHLKAVLLNAKGEVVHCLQLPCPLWKGLDYLQRAILHALQAFKIQPSKACHAITMTGELVDLFENRQQGVGEIAKVASELLGEHVWFYAANNGFVNMLAVTQHALYIASSNWHASASALAQHVNDALFVDIGSTTTDIIVTQGSKVLSAGLSDAYRMQADSLVYTGVVRTPIMALTQKIVFDGVETNVAAEFFATMADVYRLTGELATDNADAADGKGKTQLESARRLARMIGHDVYKNDFDKDAEKWIKLAFACRNLHLQQIKTAMLKQLKPNMTIIGAGVGGFLVKTIAEDLNYHFIQAWEQVSIRLADHVDLSLQHDIGVCFSAYAVAYLMQKQTIC